MLWNLIVCTYVRNVLHLLTHTHTASHSSDFIRVKKCDYIFLWPHYRFITTISSAFHTYLCLFSSALCSSIRHTQTNTFSPCRSYDKTNEKWPHIQSQKLQKSLALYILTYTSNVIFRGDFELWPFSSDLFSSQRLVNAKRLLVAAVFIDTVTLLHLNSSHFTC